MGRRIGMPEERDRLAALLPCPFCGGEPNMAEVEDSLLIACRGCNVDMYSRDDKRTAAAMWNKRAGVTLKEPGGLIRTEVSEAAQRYLTATLAVSPASGAAVSVYYSLASWNERMAAEIALRRALATAPLLDTEGLTERMKRAMEQWAEATALMEDFGLTDDQITRITIASGYAPLGERNTPDNEAAIDQQLDTLRENTLRKGSPSTARVGTGPAPQPLQETTLKIWTCKIGEVNADRLPYGSDWPMRQAIIRAYREITGQDADFIFSGWGGSLTEPERAVVEDREPVGARPSPLEPRTPLWEAESLEDYLYLYVYGEAGKAVSDVRLHAIVSELRTMREGGSFDRPRSGTLHHGSNKDCPSVITGNATHCPGHPMDRPIT
jgi:Lar family restriction alleviation protein